MLVIEGSNFAHTVTKFCPFFKFLVFQFFNFIFNFFNSVGFVLVFFPFRLFWTYTFLAKKMVLIDSNGTIQLLRLQLGGERSALKYNCMQIRRERGVGELLQCERSYINVFN